MTHCRLEGCHGEVFDHDHSVLCVGQCWGQLLSLWSTVSHHSHGIIHQILGVETEYLAMDHETGSKTAPSPPLLPLAMSCGSYTCALGEEGRNISKPGLPLPAGPQCKSRAQPRVQTPLSSAETENLKFLYFRIPLPAWCRTKQDILSARLNLST